MVRLLSSMRYTTGYYTHLEDQDHKFTASRTSTSFLVQVVSACQSAHSMLTKPPRNRRQPARPLHERHRLGDEHG